MPVPYLEQPPAVIPVDVGRQLFVDDFLVEKSSMRRAFHYPVKHPGNPVFFPQTKYERNDRLAPCAVPKCGGIWYDPWEKRFKMWYLASYLGAMAYATSEDGIHWERPMLDIVPGTNLILDPSLPRFEGNFDWDGKFHPDSGTVWVDEHAPDGERFKMFIREAGAGFPGLLFTSADGIHWSDPVRTGTMMDRSTMFFNPFRKKWVHSIRWCDPIHGRNRLYWEGDDFLKDGQWILGGEPADRARAASFWVGADCMDQTRDIPPQLYNLDAVAYESLMVGFFQILKGPENHIAQESGLPKLTELVLATSRDGFHWHRPDRNAFIGARREPGSWEYGYVESTGGLCLVVGDELWFYYSAYAGDPERKESLTGSWTTSGAYANGAVGLAKLRRDGFASMQACFQGADLTTRSLVFTGGHLFVNVDTSGTLLRAEFLDENGAVIEPYTLDRCRGVCTNSTQTEIKWTGVDDFKALSGKPVKLRFQMDRGDLYSFWITDSPSGASHGYLAAGGPGLPGGRDD